MSSPQPSATHAALAQARLDALAKPPGSLGRAEALVVQFAALQAQFPPVYRPKVVVFAADHGVARHERVTPYPPEVTPLMVLTFAAGRAAVSVLARAAGAALEVVDVGVNGLPARIAPAAGVELRRASVAPGTRNLAVEPAMSAETRDAAMAVGAQVAHDAADAGYTVLALGEMGIGNSTAAAALAARLLGAPAEALVGPGTGLDPAGVAHKASVVARGLARGGPQDPLGALADLGGLELAALVGCIQHAAARGLLVVLDGFIVGAAALVAVQLDPSLRAALVAATASAEPGHAAILAALDLGAPLLTWQLRLGEASGAALALPLIGAACRIPTEMATLAEVLGAPPAG